MESVLNGGAFRLHDAFHLGAPLGFEHRGTAEALGLGHEGRRYGHPKERDHPQGIDGPSYARPARSEQSS